jgi:membrane protease YdiL (CAAX protease family)
MQPGGKQGGALHGGLLLAIVAVIALVLPPLSWPLHLLLPLLIYFALVLILPSLRRTAPRFALGRMGGAPLACAAAISVITSAVLIGFHVLARPEVSELAAKVPVDVFGNLVLAGVCFSIANAVLEELVFRWVLWEVIADEWNSGVALVVTAVLFGMGHLHGYPPGPLGAVLAGVYGLALGLFRWRTGGLGLAIGCHVCADVTIFALLFRNDGACIAPPL